MEKAFFRIVFAFLVMGLMSCVSGPKTAEEYRVRGGEYLEKADYSNALADFDKAIEIEPSLARAYHNRGQVYFLTANTEEDLFKAIKEFEQALKIDPSFIRAGYANAYISNSYYRMGDYANARLYANKALEIENDNEMALKIIAEIDKKDAETKARAENIAKIQKEIDAQFGKIDKSKYQEVEAGAGLMALLGMGSPYEIGKKYKTTVLTGMNTQYGATFTDSITAFVDPNRKVPNELIGINGFYIYFTVNRISRNDHYITLEYIELPE